MGAEIKTSSCEYIANTRLTERATRSNAMRENPESFLYVALYHMLTLKLLVFELRKSYAVKRNKNISPGKRRDCSTIGLKMYLPQTH